MNMKTCAMFLALATASATFAAEPPSWATKDLRAGIIGTDTSHVPAFTGMFRPRHTPAWALPCRTRGGSTKRSPATAGHWN